MTQRLFRRQTWLLLLLSSVLLLCGLAAVVLYGRQQTLTCQRSADEQLTCRQQISWFKIIPLEEALIIQSPRSAETEVHCRTDSETGTYDCASNGVRLLTPTGPVSFSSDFFNEITARQAVDRLNQFFRDPAEQQIVIDSQNTITVVMGFACVVVPFLICGGLLVAAVAGQPATKRT